MFIRSLCGVVLLCVIVFDFSFCQDGTYFLKASKSVPRIGKRSKNNNNDDFEKFFLKASKSVPRIGRRGSPSEFALTSHQSDTNIKYPTWSDLAELYEYNPELFASPQILSKLEDYGMLGDDPHVNWDRFKRTNIPANYDSQPDKEIVELRLQPEK